MTTENSLLKVQLIEVGQLLLDPDNPRLESGYKGNKEMLDDERELTTLEFSLSA
jgi:hypothetical protein